LATLPRALRRVEFFDRLAKAASAASHDEARALVDGTLNAVEDEYSGVPFNPANWKVDGRMYPPQDDRASDVEGHPGVIVYGSKRHNTFIAQNGAIEIQTLDGVVEFTKNGADGNGVWS
jgi:hypothetical protein